MTPLTSTLKDTGTVEVKKPSEREVVVSRVFNAPREVVFDAMTNPELVKQWHRLEVCEIDLRVGGAWRFVGRGIDGTLMTSRGVILALERPERFAQTMETEAEEVAACADAGAAVATVLTEKPGQTVVTSTLTYPSQEMRDAVIDDGFERGVTRRFDLLARYLESVA